MPSIWALIGFFLFAFAGAYFYYRELAEITGRRAKEDLESFRDDEVLISLQPVATVAFRRSLPLGSGSDLTAKESAGGTLEIERIALPITQSRGLPDEARRAFHGHQVLALAEAFSILPPAQAGPYAWPSRERVEARILAEWPGYSGRLAELGRLEREGRPLYPSLAIRPMPLAAPARTGGEGAQAEASEPQSKEDAPVREQRRSDRDPEKDRGLHIERIETLPDSSRRWAGEQRDEESAGPDDRAPEGPMDLTDSRTPALHVVRTQARPPERTADAEGLRYDEWDVREGRYRRHYCRVHAQAQPVVAGHENRTLELLASKRQVVREVIRLFDALRPIPKRRGRQPDGDGIDLDAYVDAAVQLRLGGSLEENFYERHLRVERSVAVTLLLDLSASTERWVGRRRAFEIGIETATLFALGQQALGDEVEILGFSGNGPENVRISNLKLFDEPWSDRVFDRLDSVRPQSFTRLGAAIRHANRDLSERKTQHKLLLLLSDASPQDQDGYEGQYGWADVRRALDESRRSGVHLYCLTMDADAAPHLRLLFRNQYCIHLDPETLPLKLPRVFAQLTHQE